MDEKELRVKGMFDKVARRYDFLNRLMSLGLDVGWKKETARKVARKGALVLDVACGTGDIAMAAKALGAKVVGVDFSLEMLKIAKKRDASIGYIRANAIAMPFRSEVFDGATSGFAMRNFSDMNKALREMRRVLKKDGKLAIIEFGHPKNRLWESLYKIHIDLIVPFMGAVFSDRESYAYLPESIRKFPGQEGLKKIMESEGFKTGYQDLLWGAAAIWTGIRSNR